LKKTRETGLSCVCREDKNEKKAAKKCKKGRLEKRAAMKMKGPDNPVLRL